MTKNNIRTNDLKSVFKSSALVGTLWLLANVGLINLLTMSQYYGADLEKAEQYKKLLFTFSTADGSNNDLLVIFATLFPMILAWQMFSFVNKKKCVNVYFSLGITRKDMFVNRFIAGSFIMITAIAVPFIVGTVWNISVFGSSITLFQSVSYIAIRMIVSSLFAFSLTVLISSLVGTKGEQFVLAPCLVFAVNAISFFAESLKKLLFYGGAEIGRNSANSLYLNDYTHISSRSMDELYNNLNRFNNLPIINNNNIIDKYLTVKKEAIKSPADMLALAGLILMVSVLVFFAYKAFVNRKAENAGFLGASPFANIVLSAFVAIGIGAVAGIIIDSKWRSGTIDKIKPIAVLAILAAIFLFTYIILMPILTRNKKVFIKTMWKLPIFVFVLMIPALVLVTGVFGEVNRIPEVGEIKAANVSVPIDISLTGNTLLGNRYDGYINFEGTSDFNLVGFTSEKDIEKIRKIHKSVIEVKPESESRKRPYMDNLIINYELKDGTILSRRYDYFNKAVADELLKIVDSDFLKDEYINTFDNTVPMTEEEYEKYAKNFSNESGILRYTNAVNSSLNGRIVEIINSQGKVTDISMDEVQTNELRKAVAKDLKTVPLSKIYFSQKHSVGTIKFKEPEESGRGYDPFAPKIPIVEDMKNTLEYLESFGFSKKQGIEEKPFLAIVYDIKDFRSSGTKSSGMFEEYYLFSERTFSGDSESDAHYEKMMKSGFAKFDSEDSLAKLQSLSLTNQYTYNEGYVVLYKYSDKTQRAEYVPYDKMPDELKPV